MNKLELLQKELKKANNAFYECAEEELRSIIYKCDSMFTVNIKSVIERKRVTINEIYFDGYNVFFRTDKGSFLVCDVKPSFLVSIIKEAKEELKNKPKYSTNVEFYEF